MSLTLTPMTDEHRRAIALEYLKRPRYPWLATDAS
jgi:hypothetical protein